MTFIEKLEREYEQKKEDILKIREELEADQKRLEDIKRELDQTRIQDEKRKKFEKEKKEHISFIKIETNKNKYEDFSNKLEAKIKKRLKDDDLNRVKEIIISKDNDLKNLKKEIEKLEKKHDESSIKLEEAEKVCGEIEKDIFRAIENLKKQSSSIKVLKKTLAKCEQLLEISDEKKEYLKMAFYYAEIGKTIGKIMNCSKGIDEIEKRLDQNGLLEKESALLEAKKEFNDLVKALQDKRNLVAMKERSRMRDILKEIDGMSSK